MTPEGEGVATFHWGDASRLSRAHSFMAESEELEWAERWEDGRKTYVNKTTGMTQAVKPRELAQAEERAETLQRPSRQGMLSPSGMDIGLRDTQESPLPGQPETRRPSVSDVVGFDSDETNNDRPLTSESQKKLLGPGKHPELGSNDAHTTAESIASRMKVMARKAHINSTLAGSSHISSSSSSLIVVV